MDVGGEIELSRQAAILAVSDLLPIHPQVECRIYTIEDNEYLPSFPVFGDGKGAEVRPGLVRFFRSIRRVAFIEGIIRRQVTWETVTKHLPIAGNGNDIPIAGIEIW